LAANNLFTTRSQSKGLVLSAVHPVNPTVIEPALATLPATAAGGLAAPSVLTGAAREVLLLFWHDWDMHALAWSRAFKGDRIKPLHYGFDLFKFPSNARLMTFNVWRAIERLEKKLRGRTAAVLSNDEQFGALMGAVLGQRLQLHGNDPRAVIACHHKWESREIQRRAAPASVPAYCAFAYEDIARGLPPAGLTLPYPFFVKPLKATFSVLAREIDSLATLRTHMRFAPFEKHIIRRLIRPFNDISARIAPSAVDAAWLIGEEIVRGHQLNVDGYVHNGDVRVVGIVDEWMMPNATGTAQAFSRFEYPSYLSADVQARAKTLVAQVITAHGFTHGFFNIELFWHKERAGCENEFTIIEINPRMAAQMADFYLHVDGLDLYAMELAMALGQDPASVPRVLPRYGAAASAVWRSFEAVSCPRLPTVQDYDWVAKTLPGAQLHVFAKRGAQLQRELKWLGSHRWAILNYGARDAQHLRALHAQVCMRLQWPCHWSN
jgi:hypothetical protein